MASQIRRRGVGSSSILVAGLTAAAVATVGFLAYQASASMPPGLDKGHGIDSPAVTNVPARTSPTDLPGGSGAGERVVYSLRADRVWVVGTGDKVKRTFPVTPGSVDPAPGTYKVTSRSGSVTGTDGTPVEHVVRFTSVDGVTVGFSAAVDGSMFQAADPTMKTGGIRQSRADGDAMWDFATIGRAVVVVL